MKTLVEFLKAVQHGSVLASYAQQQALDRTLHFNQKLHALREWRESIQEVNSGPLAGVTISLKDNIAFGGMQTFAGSSKALPHVWAQTGSFVNRLQSLGAIVTSKSHCAEFALGGSGYNPNQGTPLNPWLNRTPLVPGGSSSGTAVAVASGMAMFGVGTDTGGSVRVPAALCGCVGYRSSIGHWPMDGVVPLLQRADTLGLITKNLQDMLCVVQSVDSCAAFHEFPASKLKIALWPAEWMGDCDRDRLQTYKRACEALSQAGCTLLTAGQTAMEIAHARLINGPNTAAIEFARFVDKEIPEWRNHLNPHVAKLYQENQNIDDSTLQARHDELIQLSEYREDFFAGADFVLSPTTGQAPPPITELISAEGYEKYSNSLLNYTVMGSLFRCCGISLPAGLDQECLPIGLQLLGRPNDDHRLLSAALTLQPLLDKTPSLPPMFK